MAVGYDLIQAVIAQLEANSAIQTAFGDTWNQATQTGVAKFFADVVDQVPPPYCLIEEGGETYDFMTSDPAINFTSPGQMSFRILRARSRAGSAAWICNRSGTERLAAYMASRRRDVFPHVAVMVHSDDRTIGP